MKDTAWGKLSSLQLGHYAEQYAAAQLMMDGCKVYSKTLDDYGVDLVIKNPQGIFIEIQVKAGRLDGKNDPYPYMKKETFSAQLYVMLLLFRDGEQPDIYLLNATDFLWEDRSLIANYEYDKPGLKSKPEYGLKAGKSGFACLEKNYRYETRRSELLEKADYRLKVHPKPVIHHVAPDTDGAIYCRRRHEICIFSENECRACPLYGGCIQGSGVECLYEDYETPAFEPLTPQRERVRINDLIRMGIISRTAERPELPSVVDEAIRFATKAHSGAFRKGTSTPYILHPLEAAAITSTMTERDSIWGDCQKSPEFGCQKVFASLRRPFGNPWRISRKSNRCWKA